MVTKKKPRSASPKKITVIKDGKKVVQNNTRPKLWSEAYLKRVMPKAVENTGGVATDIAKNLGCSKQTLYKYQEKYPWIEEMRQDARESFVDLAEGKLMKKVREEDLKAITYTLNNLGKLRGYSNQPDVIITNQIGDASIQFEAPIDITPKKNEVKDKTDEETVRGMGEIIRPRD